MNQQTLQKIYKTFEPEEFYKRYFEKLQIREDSRSFTQIRDIKISIKNNTIALSKGQTIVICQINTTVQKVIYNSIEKSYGKPLISLSIALPNIKSYSNRQNKSAYSIEEFVNNKIQWREIEDQLVVKETGNKYFAHTGEISIRIVSNDGAIGDACLLATQLLLWTNKFNKIDSETGQLKQQSFLLEIPYFLYPMNYCEIMNQLLFDPSKNQEDNCSYAITIIGDLLSTKLHSNYLLIQRLKKGFQKISQEILNKILELWKQDISKPLIDINDLRRRVMQSTQSDQAIDILISL